MREMITIVVCLFFFLVSLQMGLIRTGQDYSNLAKQVETLQTANDNLTQELQHLTSGKPGSADQQVIADLRAELEQYQEPEGERLARLKTAQAKLESVLERDIKKGGIHLQQDKGSLFIRIQDGLLFAATGGRLLRSGTALLEKIAYILRDFKDMEVRVIAYTDLPAESTQTSKQYEVLRARSLDQAEGVANFLQSRGEVDPVQILAAGYGPYRPLVPNDSDYHRAQNRRLEIVLRPVSENVLNQARQIVSFETRPREQGSTAVSAPVGPKNIGADALEEEDNLEFEGGYERPPGK